MVYLVMYHTIHTKWQGASQEIVTRLGYIPNLAASDMRYRLPVSFGVNEPSGVTHTERLQKRHRKQLNSGNFYKLFTSSGTNTKRKFCLRFRKYHKKSVPQHG